MRFGIWHSKHWFGVRLGKWYVSIRGPENRPLFSERNRIACRVLPLGRGWRIVIAP